MPDVRNQHTLASPSKRGLDSLDEMPADATASGPLRYDQFAQVRPEAQVVGTDKASDRGIVLPDQRQVTGTLDTPRQGRIGPIALPKSGLRLHQPANGWKIFASGYSNHVLCLFIMSGYRIVAERRALERSDGRDAFVLARSSGSLATYVAPSRRRISSA
jgi:hypothetical protein